MVVVYIDLPTSPSPLGHIPNVVPIPNPEHGKLRNLIAGRKAYEKRGMQHLVSGERRGMRSVHLDLRGVVAEVVLGGEGDDELKISSQHPKPSRSLSLRVGRFRLRSGKHLITSELDKVTTLILNHPISPIIVSPADGVDELWCTYI